MKIQRLKNSFEYCQKPKNKQLADGNIRTSSYGMTYFNVISPKHFIAVNQISFKAHEHTGISKLISQGYERAEIGINGQIANHGKNIIISSADDLIAVSKSENAWRNNYVLSTDIDLKNKDFYGIGNIKRGYSGVFDGNGYVLKNLSIKKGNYNSVGLFRVCNNAHIKNLKIENAQIIGKNDVGIVVGSAENNTELENISVNGNLTALNVAGGLIGFAQNTFVSNCFFNGGISPLKNEKQENDDDSFFIQKKNQSSEDSGNFFGGAVGIAENSKIFASGIKAKVNGERITGGFIGLSNWSDICDCVFSGEVNNPQKSGFLVGAAENSKITNSYALTERKLIGEQIKSSLSGCFSDIRELNYGVHNNWNTSVWNISPKKLPRLKKELCEMDPITVFIEDINNDIKNENIKIGFNYRAPKTISIKLDDMEPPKHYPENEKILSEINNCNDSSKLSKLFAYWTDSYRMGFDPEDKKHDEILLALVRNKKFNMNERWNTDNFKLLFRAIVLGRAEAATYCTPLYVLSSLNKGYIFNEALKRDDIDPFVQSGSYKTTDIFERLYEDPISTNMFLLFNSKNPTIKKYVRQSVTQRPRVESKDRLTELLCNNPIEKFKFNEFSNEVQIPVFLLPELKKISDINIIGKDKYFSLWDIVNSPDIPANYSDSQNNNIFHLISSKTFPISQQLTCFEIAKNNGTDLNAKNIYGMTPYMQSLANKNDLLCFAMLKAGVQNKYSTDANGDNALLVNVKYNKSKQANLIAENLHNLGFSLNTCNKTQSTPLIEAVKNNDLQKINYLLTNGAAVDLCDINGQTALHHAFIQRNIPVIKWLMDSYACLEVKDKMGFTPQDYWLDCNTDIEFKKLNWDAAVMTYNFAGIQDIDSLSLNMTDINSLSRELENIRTFDFNNLKNRGFSLEKALIKLYCYLCNDTNNILADKTKSNELLAQLAQTNNPYCKECLLKVLKNSPVDVNSKNKDGETPLLLALKSYQTARTSKEKLSCMQNIKCLLDYGADVDIDDMNGQTPLHHAVFTNNIILFNELLGKHPNVNHTDILGKNPLQYLSPDPEDPMRKVYYLYAQKRALNQ